MEIEGLPAPIASPKAALPQRPVNLAEVRRKLSSSGNPYPQLKAPNSPTSPTVADWSSDDNRSPQLGSSVLLSSGSLSGSPPRAGHVALPLAAISETDDAGDSEDDDAGENSDHEDREHGMKGLYSETAIKYGYLQKKGERRKNWKKRYFVLRPNRFGYYKDEKEYKLLRDIPLVDIRTCATVQVKKHDYSFGIVTAKRTYYCKANSQQDAEDWVAKIDSTARAAKEHKSDGAKNVVRNGSDTPQGEIQPVPMSAKPRQRSVSGGRDPAAVSVSSTQPIAIASSSNTTHPQYTQYQTSFPSTSYSSTISSVQAPSSVATNSPFSPSETLPSSYTSQFSTNPNSSGAVTPSGPPNVPPNSLSTSVQQTVRRPSQPADTLPPPIELGGVNASLSRLSLNGMDNIPAPPLSPHSRRKMSFGASSTNERGGTVSAYTVASSSEDEDEEDDDIEDLPTPVPSRSPVNTTGVTFAQDPDKIVVQGYLTKQGKRKNWRKRWFTLSSQRLSYSRSHMDQKVNRQIPLGRILDVVEIEGPSASSTSAPTRSGRSGSISNMHAPDQSTSPVEGLGLVGFGSAKTLDHCFKIITAKRTFTLCATDEEQEIKWISAIRVLLSASRKVNPASPAIGNSTIGSPSILKAVEPIQQQPLQQSKQTEIARPAGGSAMESIDSRIQKAMESGPASTHSRQVFSTSAAKEESQRLDASNRLKGINNAQVVQ